MRSPPVTSRQLNLLSAPEEEPAGFAYRPDLLSAAEEQALVGRIAGLPLQPFRFHGFEGKRRTCSFGWHYAFDGSGLQRAEPLPDWLLPAREHAAALAGIPAGAFEHALLIEYGGGAGIGWHRDRPVFGDVVGLSLLGPARLRFRQRADKGWRRRAAEVEPRSAYLLRGPARWHWEHSIPAVTGLRYAITLRTIRAEQPPLPPQA